MFVLNSDVTIGSFRFSGVNDIRINKSMLSIVETASIKIPSIGRITRNAKVMPETIITAKQFKRGDTVLIKLGYNGQLETEFVGFVSSINIDMPLTIECEGYSWLMRRNAITGFYRKISLKDLLTLAVSKTGTNKINVICDLELDFCNILLESATGLDLIKRIHELTDNTLTCYFISSETLWCGLTHSAHTKTSYKIHTVDYRLGYNTIKENSLKIKDIVTDTVEVTYSKKASDGSIISKASTVFKNPSRQYKKILNHVTSAATLKTLADEKACRMCYAGYEGKVTAFLQPYAAPGYHGLIVDRRLDDSGTFYLIESTEIHYGTKGARRIIEAGINMGKKS